MLDWLRRKMGCVSSHEEMFHSGITENNINRFKVSTDPSLANECNNGVKSGILEVNEDELVHYNQNSSEPIKWSYRCVRRYGHGTDTFLFESGRRCTTGPGLFAFKCRRADVLHNVFAEKLKRFAANRSGVSVDTLRRQADFSTLQSPNRYSDDVMLASNPSHNTVADEPYLTPLPLPQVTYTNGIMMNSVNGHNGVDVPYINCAGALAEGTTAPNNANNYINTTSQPQPSTTPAVGSVSSYGCVIQNLQTSAKTTAALREINYAELDLPKSDAIGFNQTPRKPKAPASNSIDNIQYVNVNVDSDEDDEAFLPTAVETSPPPPYVNIIKSGPSVQGNGRASLLPLAPTPEDAIGTQYTTIDFQKTAFFASSAKSTQSESSQEGVRKTRHDSSADDLH